MGRAIMAAKKVSSWRLTVAALVLLGLLLLAGLQEADAGDVPCGGTNIFNLFCDKSKPPKK
jgi:hypothetical protein